MVGKKVVEALMNSALSREISYITLSRLHSAWLVLVMRIKPLFYSPVTTTTVLCYITPSIMIIHNYITLFLFFFLHGSN